MSRSERKAFDKRQRRAEDDRMWDAMCMAEMFMDDEDQPKMGGRDMFTLLCILILPFAILGELIKK